MINIRNILAAHAQWLTDPATGQRANLRRADLSDADLIDADLRRADLSDANLIGANLIGANLIGANLRRADLRRADLRRADLSDADLSDADLSDADLIGANLRRADLSGASLIDANLSGANLRRADLSGANLRRADLRRADLGSAKGLPVVADSAERLVAAATAALAEPDALQMKSWHTCDTTHCLGGWAIHQAGPLGAVLEQTLGAPIAALLLLGPEAQSHFWDSNEDARVYLQSVLDAAAS